jgi:hypothetical protein
MNSDMTRINIETDMIIDEYVEGFVGQNCSRRNCLILGRGYGCLCLAYVLNGL